MKFVLYSQEHTHDKKTRLARGGKREGAGRPHGTGKYGEPTKAIRIPQSLMDELQELLQQYSQKKSKPAAPIFKAKLSRTTLLPLYGDKVAAGFPSPAEDAIDMHLDLNEHLIKNPASTFYVRVEGYSMLKAGIHPNDILVVDRSLEPQDGHIVIALIDGEFTVKRLKIGKNKQISLLPENDNYQPLHIKEGMDFRIWGVVSNVIHSFLH